MLRFDRKYDTFKSAAPAKTGRRMLSCLIDVLIMGVVSYLLFLAGKAITTNSSAYKNAEETVQTEISYYNEMASDSGLVLFVDEEKTTRVEDGVIEFQNILRSVYHTYLNGGDGSTPAFEIEEEDLETVSQFGESSPETDSLAHFYLVYTPAHNEDNGIFSLGGLTYQEFYYNTLEDGLGSEYTAYFDFPEGDDDNPQVPMMKTEIASCIYHYFYVDESDGLGQSGKTYYDNLDSAYANMLTDAETLLIQSEPYNSEHYTVYRAAYETECRLIDLTMFLACFIGALLAIELPKLLLGNMRTIGRLALGIGVISDKGETIPVGTEIGMALLSSLGFEIVSFLLFLLPPLFGIFDPLLVSLFGSFRYFHILLIILAIDIINSLFCAFSSNGQTLLERAFSLHTVDPKREGYTEEDQPGARDY